MRFGDLSNHTSPVVAFDLDDLLFSEDKPKLSFFQRIFKRINYLNRPFNEKLLNLLTFIWNRYDFSIYLVTFSITSDEDLNYLFERLSMEGVAVTNIIYLQEWEDVRYRISNGRYKYFVTSNADLINYVGENALHISDVRSVF